MANGLHSCPKLALDGEILNDSLDNPIAVTQLWQVVLEVSWRYQGGFSLTKEGGRLLFNDGVYAALGGGVPVSLSGQYYIQQQGWVTGIGKVGGNPRPHGSGAQYGDSTKSFHVGGTQSGV